MAHFINHTSVSSSQFTDMLEIIIFQLAQIGFLSEESFQTLLLLLIQIQLFQLLLQGLKIRSEIKKRKKETSSDMHTIFSFQVGLHTYSDAASMDVEVVCASPAAVITMGSGLFFGAMADV